MQQDHNLTKARRADVTQPREFAVVGNRTRSDQPVKLVRKRHEP
jgi:hypothetical protein